jgi:hypothetical protein
VIDQFRRKRLTAYPSVLAAKAATDHFANPLHRNSRFTISRPTLNAGTIMTEDAISDARCHTIHLHFCPQSNAPIQLEISNEHPPTDGDSWRLEPADLHISEYFEQSRMGRTQSR